MLSQQYGAFEFGAVHITSLHDQDLVNPPTWEPEFVASVTCSRVFRIPEASREGDSSGHEAQAASRHPASRLPRPSPHLRM